MAQNHTKKKPSSTKSSLQESPSKIDASNSEDEPYSWGLEMCEWNFEIVKVSKGVEHHKRHYKSVSQDAFKNISSLSKLFPDLAGLLDTQSDDIDQQINKVLKVLRLYAPKSEKLEVSPDLMLQYHYLEPCWKESEYPNEEKVIKARQHLKTKLKRYKKSENACQLGIAIRCEKLADLSRQNPKEPDKALKYYEEASLNYLSPGMGLKRANLEVRMGNVCHSRRDEGSAIRHYIKALRIYEARKQHSSPSAIFASYCLCYALQCLYFKNNQAVGIISEELGLAYESLDTLDTLPHAFDYFTKSLEEYKTDSSKRPEREADIARIHFFMGKTCEKMNKIKEANEYYHQARKFYRKPEPGEDRELKIVEADYKLPEESASFFIKERQNINKGQLSTEESYNLTRTQISSKETEEPESLISGREFKYFNESEFESLEEVKSQSEPVSTTSFQSNPTTSNLGNLRARTENETEECPELGNFIKKPKQDHFTLLEPVHLERKRTHMFPS